MGILERALAEISAEWTWRRMATKWEDSFSPASGERRGAQRLQAGSARTREKNYIRNEEGDSRFAVADISLHFLN